MLESVKGLLAEHKQLQEQLSDASVHQNPALAKKLNRRYAELSAIVAAYDSVNTLTEDLAAAKELAKEDDAFADEVPATEEKLTAATEKLRRLLIPRDPDDGRDVIMEIKAGEGGAESALFAADLLRMYIQYANSKGWKTEILDKNESDLGGYKDVQIAIKSNTTDPAQGVYAHLKYEGGVHRVQRVPVTETQGRIHTSAAGVLLAAQQEAIEAEQSAARKSQVRTVDRSERIRTYNFPENRIADHRTGYKSYNLDQVMDGALEPVVQSAIQMDEEARLAALGGDK